MRYEKDLAAGYPIATGVIEGACLHLVKDRLERSGRRWRRAGAAPRLSLRALRLSHVWDEFHHHRQPVDLASLHPHRHLLANDTPENITI